MITSPQGKLSPTDQVLSSLISKLSNPLTGFNASYPVWFPAVASVYPTQFDWTNLGKNVFYARTNVVNIEKSSVIRFPAIKLYGIAWKNANLQKFRIFSGLVSVGFDIEIGGRVYKSNSLPSDCESYPSALDATFLYLVNSPNASDWSDSVAYNGDIGSERSEVEPGGDNWTQTIRYKLTAQVNI